MEVSSMISGVSAYSQSAKIESVKKDGEAGKKTSAEETTKVEAAEKPNQDTFETTQKVTSDEEKGAANAELVKQLKDEMEQIKSRFVNLVRDMIGKQNKQVALTDENIWKFVAQGDYEVDVETQEAAKEAISENGYWGVAQTSQRLLSFAQGLTGGDPAKAEEMWAAVEKGFREAEEAWGGQLPEIAQQTYDAAKQLFDDWANQGAAAAVQ